VSARKSAGQKKRWAKRGARKRQSEKLIRAYASPEARALKSKVGKEIASRPGARERFSARMKAARADPIKGPIWAANLAKANAKPAVQKRKRAGAAKARATPQWLAAVSTANADPGKIARMVATLKITNTKPEVYERRSAASKKFNARPEVRRKKSVSGKLAAARPEVQAARAEGRLKAAVIRVAGLAGIAPAGQETAALLLKKITRDLGGANPNEAENIIARDLSVLVKQRKISWQEALMVHNPARFKAMTPEVRSKTAKNYRERARYLNGPKKKGQKTVLCLPAAKAAL